MDIDRIKNNDQHSCDWVIYVVNSVKDRPSRNSYQRIIALAHEFNIIVITSTNIPSALVRLVDNVILVKNGKDVWSAVMKSAKRLQDVGVFFYVHTQYSPIQAVAGYLCKRQLGCKWVYDLWDHPSLTYRARKGPSRWIRQLIDLAIRQWVLAKADVWIIAMHPAILGYMPPAPTSCRVIFTQPGVLAETRNNTVVDQRSSNKSKAIKVAYTGAITGHRLNSLVGWIGGYQGGLVDLHLIGQSDNKESSLLLTAIEEASLRNPNMSFKYHGELSYHEVLEILRTSDIGICPLDMSVLNYRFAFAIKIVEQMNLGLVVVANESHGVCAYIKDGENGILAKNEVNGLSNALGKAINACLDPVEKERMSRSAIKAVKNDTWSLKNKRLVGLIKATIKV